MRPLAVLILVLGAIAALVFALSSLSDRGGRGTVAEGLVTKPALAREEGPAPDPSLPRQPAVTQSPAVERSVAEDAREADTGALTGRILGQVVDVDGVPVEEARVSLVQNKGDDFGLTEALGLLDASEPADPVRRMVTGKDGRFDFRGLEPGGGWHVVVSHSRYPRAAAGPILVPTTGSVEERVVLRAGLALTGLVTAEETGVPIPNARLSVENPMAEFVPNKKRQGEARQATTDEEGRFLIEKLGGGQRTLEIRAAGYATLYVPNFGNQLQQKLSEARRTPQTNGARVVTLTQGISGPVEMDFQLARGQSIAGRVLRPDRGGLEGARVKVTNMAGNSGSRGEALTTGGGEFLIEDLGAGVYSLVVDAEGYESTPLQRVEVGRTDVEIVMAAQGGVAGRVLDAETGRPVSRYTLRVRQHNPRNISWGGEVAKRKIRDATDGGFSISGISQGTYVVEAVTPGFASSFSAPFEVQQGIQTQDIVVRLNKGGTLRGRVLDGVSKEPIAGATVRTFDNNWIDSEIMSILGGLNASATSKIATKTDDEGRWELTLLTPDVYQVRVERQGYSTITMNDVSVESGPAIELPDFQLLRGAMVTGVVVGPNDEPIAAANVSMRSVDGSYFDSYSARSDANGRYTIHNAKAGVYKLHASRATSANSSPFAPVLELQQSEIEITISEGGQYEYTLHLPEVSH